MGGRGLGEAIKVGNVVNLDNKLVIFPTCVVFIFFSTLKLLKVAN